MSRNGGALNRGLDTWYPPNENLYFWILACVTIEVKHQEKGWRMINEDWDCTPSGRPLSDFLRKWVNWLVGEESAGTKVGGFCHGQVEGVVRTRMEVRRRHCGESIGPWWFSWSSTLIFSLKDQATSIFWPFQRPVAQSKFQMSATEVWDFLFPPAHP